MIQDPRFICAPFRWGPGSVPYLPPFMARRRRYRPWLDPADAIAAFWLGEVVPPPEAALRSSGWRPDPRMAYCPRCGLSLSTRACFECCGRRFPWRALVRLGAYGAPLSDWVLAIKGGPRWAEMGERLGLELGAALRRANLGPERAVVVPVPMPPLRRWHRGIDHAREIAEGVAARLGLPVVQPLWRLDRAAQVSGSAAARARLGGIRARPSASRRVRGRAAILVDDVLTTGTTARACGRALRRLGAASVTLAVVAVAEPVGTGPRGRARRGPTGDQKLRDSIGGDVDSHGGLSTMTRLAQRGSFPSSAARPLLGPCGRLLLNAL